MKNDIVFIQSDDGLRVEGIVGGTQIESAYAKEDADLAVEAILGVVLAGKKTDAFDELVARRQPLAG